MDVETASAIERVTVRIDTLETAVRGDIARLDISVARLETRFDGLETRFAGLETRFDTLETAVRGDIARLDTRVEGLEARFETLETAVRRDIGRLDDRIGAVEKSLHADIEEGRRHAVMLNESTRDDIRMVAQAVAVLTGKVDAALRR